MFVLFGLTTDVVVILVKSLEHSFRNHFILKKERCSVELCVIHKLDHVRNGKKQTIQQYLHLSMFQMYN